MSIFLQRGFWTGIAGACMVAVVAAAPILMNGAMDRGFEIARQSLAEPLAVLAFGAMLLAGGWHSLMRQNAITKIAAASLVGFLLLAVISTLLSEHPEVAIFGGYYRREGLLAWSAYAAFFFAVLGWAHYQGRIESVIDVMLLVSVVPAAYAAQQRMGLDFYPVGVRDITRPGGTLGNALFLGAYLALLLPLTAARCWEARRQLSALALWLTVAVVQVCGLLVTQSRGPLLAALLGMLLLAGCAAGRARARHVFVGAFIVFAFTAASAVAINTLPVARQWAQEMPVVSRLVFNLDRNAAVATQLASRSAAARVAIWGAGMETFAAAPLERKLLGYGPESAYMQYFSHMPASVMRLVGYGQYNTYDRMHADTFDIGLNFGLVAWLAYALFFCAVMYAAARALWGLAGSVSAWIFFACACGGGAVASAAAVYAGLAAAAVPAFGLGVGAGWFLFTMGCAWRALRRGVAPAQQTGQWFLLAALVAALWIFWADAQVNIPVLTTRLLSFAIAALILTLAGGKARDAEHDTESVPHPSADLRVWGIAFALVAVCAGCLPIALVDAGTGAPELHWLRRILPMLALLSIAGIAAWSMVRRRGGIGGSTARAWLGIAAGLPLIYAGCHMTLMVRPDSPWDEHYAHAIAIASFAGPVFIFAMCVARALLAPRTPAWVTNAPRLSSFATLSIWVVAASVLLVAAFDWRATRADVASTLASQIAARQPQVGEQLIGEAICLLPYERYYRRQLVFNLLSRALADIRARAATSDRMATVARDLGAAESAARTAALLFPRDPWVVVALANVLQVEALQLLRPLDPAGGRRAAQEANELFAHTNRMFPSEPLLLRNWAQLVADQGNVLYAYQLLDLMEKLIPDDPEPYTERIAIANQIHDFETISGTLARARERLQPEDFAQVSIVANPQQK